MGYVYSALWVLIALMLFFRFRKENKVVYVMAVYFIFLGTWWFIDEFVTGINLMEGAYVWVLRKEKIMLSEKPTKTRYRKKMRMLSNTVPVRCKQVRQ